MRGMFRTISGLILALLVPVSCTVSCLAAPRAFRLDFQSRNTVSGQVFGPERQPLADMYVELQNDVYSTLARTKTDGSGNYSFRDLSAGRFYVRVLATGTDYGEQTQEVEIGVFVGGRMVSENIQKDFYLRPRRADSERRQTTGVIFVQSIPAAAEDTFKKAISDLDSNEAEEGIRGLQKALGIFPEYFQALERLGCEFTKLRRYEEAVTIYKKAIAVNSRSYWCWYGLSYASYALQRSTEAIEAAARAVSLNSKSAEAFLILGLSHRQAKDYDKAEEALKEAKKLSKGKMPDVHWNLALLYAHNLKRYKEAADELELYLKAKPDAENVEAIKKLIKKFREQVYQSKS